ncbi:MAG TPA: non-heme iron oxygenase ferredoxin subunit [Candidatus Dormibacteraeota bacterium]|jgi:3-phenylpropionate/trans-cinnamate dioxygenase ferredoxin subunit|nr:non-heme iron oxygenase ferredoxin subunit [Candidatus Dormibacteraeota bacterium]
MAKHLVAKVGELGIGTMRRISVNGEEICLAHAEDGAFYAISDVCTHEEYSLSEGELWGLEVECPAHGSRFNLRTGQVTGLPAVMPARVYEVSVEGDDVYVEV